MIRAKRNKNFAHTLGVIQQAISHRLIINTLFLIKKKRWKLICTPDEYLF